MITNATLKSCAVLFSTLYTERDTHGLDRLNFATRDLGVGLKGRLKVVEVYEPR